MSVINKALKELNKRNSGDEYGKYVPPEKSAFSFNKIALISLAVMGIAVLGAAGYYAYKMGEQSKQSGTKVQAETTKASQQASAEKQESDLGTDKKDSDISMVAEQPAESSVISEKNEEDESTQDNELIVLAETEPSISENSVSSGETEDVPYLDVNKKSERKLVKNNTRNTDSVKKSVKTHSSTEAVNDSVIKPQAGAVVDSYVYDADNYVIEEQPVISEKSRSKPSSLKVSKSNMSPADQKAMYRSQALNYLGKGDSRKAVEAYKNVLAVDPRDIEAREKLAGLYYGQDNHAEAIRVLDRGIALTPTHYDYRLFLSRIYKAHGDNAKALKVLEKANPPVAGNIDYYATMASIARESGDYVAASKAYTALASTNTSDGKWYLGLGISEEKQGRHRQALEAYRKASTLYLSQSSRKFVEGRIKFLEKLK
ncbi:tetratricopeptide repeat protein [uncultured Ruminobacter sp.]|jgi:Tfp pilus assembly protein PilF/Tfp pilus assembly protein PilV|uniref:tetratricopeptide repeat protein n=1 Tax=uncultured Ruminobacter sp. TaxID=538947 RepID=UPI0025DCB326|nr:tetratricopeptide repeat protein [uncultured Ruminobacter sp.]